MALRYKDGVLLPSSRQPGDSRAFDEGKKKLLDLLGLGKDTDLPPAELEEQEEQATRPLERGVHLLVPPLGAAARSKGELPSTRVAVGDHTRLYRTTAVRSWVPAPVQVAGSAHPPELEAETTVDLVFAVANVSLQLADPGGTAQSVELDGQWVRIPIGFTAKAFKLAEPLVVRLELTIWHPFVSSQADCVSLDGWPIDPKQIPPLTRQTVVLPPVELCGDERILSFSLWRVVGGVLVAQLLNADVFLGKLPADPVPSIPFFLVP